MQKLASFIIISTIISSHVTANPYHARIKHNNIHGLRALCRLNTPGINEKALFGETPLQMAVVYNKPKFVALLLSAGAPILTTNNYGQTPIHSAAKLNYIDILTLLINHLKTNEDADWQTTILDWQDKHGNTALHLAAQAGNSSSIRQLLSAGANPTITNKLGLQAVTIAERLFDSYQGNDKKIIVRLSACRRCLQEKTHDREALIGNPYALLAELDGLAIE